MNVASWEVEHVRRHGDRTSLIASDRAWTGTQLFSSASRLAHALIQHGVAPGDRVVIALPNVPELFIACSAVWMAGAVVVVVPAAAEPSVARTIQHCRPAASICTPDVAMAEPMCTSVRTRIVVGGAAQPPARSCRFDDLVRDHPPLEHIVPREGSDIAQLCLTSGVTGEPRAVVYTHAGTAAFWKMAASLPAPASGQRVAVLAFPPTAFGARFIGLRFAANVRYVVLPKFVPEAVVAAIEKYRVTEVSLLPTMAEQLLAYAYSREYDCSSLRAINLSGAHVPRRLVERLKSGIGARRVWQGSDAPASAADSERCAVIVHYGLTETGGGVASTTAGGDGLVGRVAPGVEIRIVDESGYTVTPGQTGEILARGPYAGCGYWEDPEAAAAVFCDGYVRTGDLGSLDENGELRIEGRKKDIIIQGGYNVPAREVVTAITRLAGVSECAVVGLPNELLGEEVVACVVRAAGAQITEAEVLAKCREQLDPRKLPGRTLFFDELPRTHTGKPDLRVLRDRVEAIRASRAGSPLLESLRLEGSARRSVLLRDLVRNALEQVLPPAGSAAPSRAEDPAHDALFGELGLDSLGAVRFADLLAEQLGSGLSPIAIYANPSIAALSAWIEEQWFNGRDRVPTVAAGLADKSEDAGVIGIVGIGCRLPGGVNDPHEYWALLESGIDTVREPPAERNFPEPQTCKAAFLHRADHFDAGFFRLRAQASSIDPRHRMLLEVAWQALEDAGQAPLALSQQRAGLFVGIFGHRYGQPDALESAPGMAVSYLCQFLDIRGPVVSVDTTCSSSLVAVHNAVCSLRKNECDIAIVGGVNLIAATSSRGTLGVTSADGRTKAFDACADGFGRGEGCVLLVLKRVADAERAGDRVYATIRGTAINHDGRSSSLTAPSAAAQADVIRLALGAARIASDTVQYVEAHGSGTVLGDPIEIDGLARVFGPRRKQPLEIGSVKANVGHLEAAAGAAGLARVALSIANRRLTRSLHFNTPNPHVPWASVPVRVRREAGAWPDPEAPLAAGVSAFGMSGTNAHAVLCEGPPERANRWSAADSLAATEGPWVLPVSARSAAALRAIAATWATALESGFGDASCRDIAYTASCRRAHLEHRLALVGGTRAEWMAGLRRYCAAPVGESSVLAVDGGARLIMMFGDEADCWPTELIGSEPVLRETIPEWRAAAEALVGGQSFDDVADGAPLGPAARAIAVVRSVAVQVGMYRLWNTWGVVPRAVVGRGAGEIAAAHVAGVLTREQAIRLAVARGRILGERSVSGGGAHRRVANGWIGASWQIDDAAVRMDPAAIFADALQGGVAEPSLPLFSTLTATPAPRMDHLYWARQLDTAPRTHSTFETILQEGGAIFIEPGLDCSLTPDLNETVTSCRSSVPVTIIPSVELRRAGRAAMVEALGRLYCAGYTVDWARRYSVPGRFVRLPMYQWDHSSCWNDNAAQSVGSGSERELSGARVAGPGKRINISRGLSAAMDAADPESLRRYLAERLAEFGEPFAFESGSGGRTLEALGLDSLGVIQLRARLAADLGIHLSADVVSIASTVDDVLRNMGIDYARAASTSPGTAPVAWLRRDGREPTHFWIHPIGGGIDCYRELARLSPFRSAAIEMPEISDPGRHTPSSIEEMAQNYVEAIRAAGLPRSYVLGGWSLGGVIAYEMARRLRALGQGPALVVLIDTYATSADVVSGSADASVQLAWMPTTRRPTRDSEHGTTLARLQSLNLSAWEKYSPASYDGPVLSARATAAPSQADRTWSRLAPALEIEEIEADHDSIIQSLPLERVLAAIQTRLDISAGAERTVDERRIRLSPG